MLTLRPLLTTTGLVLVSALVLVPAAGASAATAIDLGTATSFAVLGGSTVTSTGPTVVDGDLGVSPGLAVVGFPPGLLVAPSQIYSGAPAAQPQADLTTAYLLAESAIATPLASIELGGTAPLPGVYHGPTLEITGDLTLKGSATDVWIFQSDSTLVTASASRVVVTGGASTCNVYWQVGSSATLGTSSLMSGTVMALASITATTSATINGRLLARNGAVTLDTNVINAPSGCSTTATPVDPALGVVDSSGTVGGLVIVPPSTTPIPTTAAERERLAAEEAARVAAEEAARVAAEEAAAAVEAARIAAEAAEAARLEAERPQLAATAVETGKPTLVALLFLLLGTTLVAASRLTTRRLRS